ncbi:MAG: oligosaccharide flippase family protein [Bacteroidota bacterium]
MQGVSKNIFYSFFVQIPNYILGIAAGIYMTRQLGPEGKGIYTLFIANMQLLVMFLGMNLSGGLQYFVSSGKIMASKLWSISLASLVIVTIICAGLLFLPLPFDEIFFEKGYSSLFYRGWLLISFFLAVLNSVFIGFLQGKKKFAYINLVSLINAIINFFVFTSLFYLAQNRYLFVGIREVLLFTLGILFINSGLYFILFKNNIKSIKIVKFSLKEDVGTLSHFLIPSYISILINFFNYRFIIWIINYYHSSEQLGYFSLALGFSQMTLMVTMSLNIVMFSHFSSQKDVNIAIKDFIIAFKVNLYIIVFITGFLVMISSWVIPLFYGSIFTPSVIPFNILALGTIFLSQAQVFGHFFGAMNKNWTNSMAYITVLTLLIIMSFLVVPDYGIIGGAWVNTISYFILCAIFFYLIFKKYKVSIKSLLIINKEDIIRFKNLIIKDRANRHK